MNSSLINGHRCSVLAGMKVMVTSSDNNISLLLTDKYNGEVELTVLVHSYGSAKSIVLSNAELDMLRTAIRMHSTRSATVSEIP